MTSDSIDITPEARELLKDADGEARTWVGFCVKDDAQAAQAAVITNKILGWIKMLDEERKSLTAPIRAREKEVNATFATVLDTLKSAERAVKASLADYRQAQEARRIELQRQAEEEAKQKEEALKEEIAGRAVVAFDRGDATLGETYLQKAESVTVAPKKVELQAAGGVSFRDEWDFEIVDPAAVPIEYRSIDEKKIRAYGKAMKESAKVAGVRFFKKTVVAGRGNR